MSDRASELRAIADGRLMLRVRNGVTVARSMLARIADEFETMSTALAAKDAELAEAWEARAEQWRLRREAESARDMMSALATTFRAERDEARAQLAEANKALDGLLECWDEFEASYSNYEEAYYKLVKYARPQWDAARRAREAQGGER